MADERAEAVGMMNAAWRLAEQSNGTDLGVPWRMAMAQISATLYVGDQIAALAAALNQEDAQHG